MKVKVALAIFLSLIFFSGCSKKDHNPVNSTPPIQQEGRVALLNNSNVSIRIVGYYHQRGSQTQQIQLSVHIFPTQDFILHNLIDPGQSQLFPGGDKVTVYYMSDENDPGNPYQPLFQETVEVTVDGNLLIQVKNGGIYSIMPG